MTIQSSASSPYGDICTKCWSMPCRCSQFGSYYTNYGYYHFTPNVCQHCGKAPHADITECPQVKEVHYFANGKIRKIVFK